MTKITQKALIEIRKRFQDGDFIVIEGAIYKKIKCDRITIQKSEASVKSIINLILDIKDEDHKKGLNEDIKDKFKKAIKSGKFTVKDNELYKKYGGTHERGYIQFNITIDGVSYTTLEHRIIYYLYRGVWDETKVINHIDFNTSNNKIENLELISQFDNILHSIRNDYKMRYFALYMDVETKEFIN